MPVFVVLCFREGDVDAGTETSANLYHELYYHFLGTDQSEDILCWKDPENPKYMFGASVTDDGKVLVVSTPSPPIFDFIKLMSNLLVLIRRLVLVFIVHSIYNILNFYFSKSCDKDPIIQRHILL